MEFNEVDRLQRKLMRDQGGKTTSTSPPSITMGGGESLV